MLLCPFRPTVLIVTDDRADADIVNHALAAGELNCRVVWLADGQQLVDFVTSAWHEGRRPVSFADLILLKMRLPRQHGAKVLHWLRGLYRDDLASLPPSVVFSRSYDPRDVREAYQAGASSFVNVPDNEIDVAETIRDLASYWLQLSVRARAFAERPVLAAELSSV